MTPLEFFSLLYNGADAAGYIEIRYLPARSRDWMPWPVFEGHPQAYHLTRAPKEQDVYWGVSLRKETGDRDGIGGKGNCQPTPLLWTDIDLKAHPELMHGQTDVLGMKASELKEYKDTLLAQVLELCQQLNLPPRCIVDSGHGLQVYWVRRAWSDHGDTERFNKALAEAFGGDPKTVDVARILRLPGSKNRKNPKRLLPVKVIHRDADATVEDSALQALKQPQRARPEVSAAALSRSTAPLNPDESVIAQWNERNPIADVLLRYGYTREDARTYTRPGKDASGRDVKLLQNKRGVLCSYHHSSNDPLSSTDGDGHLREPFDLFCHYEHGGDFRSAARAAAVELGLQRRWENKPRTFGTLSAVGKEDGQPVRTADLPAKPTLAEFRDAVMNWCMEQGHTYRYHQTRRSWWEYQRGVYVEVLDEVMYQRVDLILQTYGFDNVKNAALTEILAKMSRLEGVAALDVDQTAWELNTRSGILDLETGELHEHSPEYFSTIQSAAYYRPEAVAHDWAAFLRQAVPGEDDRGILQMFAGLCLTGDTSAQKALLLIGEGGTGKGTFVRVLERVLGNLATSSALENIKDGSFLVGGLVGKRMCVVSELQRNVDWLPFKRITGEDHISVDVKNKTPYTTKLDLKLIILSNVMPFLGDDVTNTSLMRRFLPVAFNVKPERPDPDLERRLTHVDELPGVLNWMIQGLKRLREAGMRFPSSDTSELAREIVEESNRVIGFLRDECAYVPDVSVAVGELYDHYRKWCGRTGHGALSNTSFTKQLLAAGRFYGKPIEKQRTKHARLFVNLMLSATPQGWED